MSNKSSLVAYHTALNAFDPDVVTTMFAPDATYMSPGLKSHVVGRTAIMHAMRDYFSEFSDQISVDDEILELDEMRVQSTWRLQATSNRTGVKVQRSGKEIVTFDHLGFISKVEVIDI